MTNPLIAMLAETIREEAAMHNERIEGYCDGLAGKMQPGRSVAYRVACDDGETDAVLLECVAELRKRNAMPEKSTS